MAVRMLAGPFQIKTRDGKFPNSLGICGYYPRVGLVATLQFPPEPGHLFGEGHSGVIAFDGIYEGLFDGGLGPLSWWPERGRMNKTIFKDEFELDPRTFSHRLLKSYEFFLMGNPYVYIKERTRWLYAFPGTSAGTLTARDEATGVDSEYCTFPYGITSMCPGRGVGEVFIGGYDFTAASSFGSFFNYESKRSSSERFYYGINAVPWYSPDYQVMLTVESTGGSPPWSLKIWSQEVEPSIVTEAVVVRGEARAGCVPTYQVRVTGAQGEPCPEEFVDWTIQGAGRLEHLQSKTDKDGYAQVRVIYGLHEEGDSTIRANVRC